MNAKTRIIVNTSAQYIKTIISGILTLYSSRVILACLGVDDFGIYSLVAGVVMMLSFLTNALSSTTQRYISFYQGEADFGKVKTAFTNCLFLHIALGVIFAICFLGLTSFLFNGFLNIEELRIDAAQSIYYAVVGTLFISFIVSPFRAVLISHENIVFISIIDTLDAVLKLLIAISLRSIQFDRLVYYGWALMLVQFFNLFVFSLFCYVKYEECSQPNINDIKKDYLKGLFSFAGWNIYSLACTYGRTQGIAIVVNKFLGTVINAAYGIGLQLSSYINYMSDSLLNAIRPQIVKAEGAGNRNYMFYLSAKASKFSFFLLSILSIPCIVEMPRLLGLWLGDYPYEAIVLSRCFLAASLVDALTIGLHISNQAIGNLKKFALIINTSKLVTLPIAFVLLVMGLDVAAVGISYVLIEFICALLRLFVLRRDGLNVLEFVRKVFLKIIFPFVLYLAVAILVNVFLNSCWRILVPFTLSIVFYVPLIVCFGLEQNERHAIINVLFRIKQKWGL